MKHTDHVALLQPAAPLPPGTWADLGAGAGAFTLALRELLGPDTHIYAVDKDPARLGDLDRTYRARFLDTAGLHTLPADFSRPLELPPLDGVLMANSLHYFKDKPRILAHVRSFLKPGGALLLVEYNVDSGNTWVPYPLSFATWQGLAPRLGFTEPRLLATHPSSFLHEFYSALAYKQEH